MYVYRAGATGGVLGVQLVGKKVHTHRKERKVSNKNRNTAYRSQRGCKLFIVLEPGPQLLSSVSIQLKYLGAKELKNI